MSVERKKLVKECDDLWRQIVRLKAWDRSELSKDNVSVLHCHHVKGKSSYALRYDTRGGICITAGEHFKAHATDNYDMVTLLREHLKKREGKNILDILELQRNRTGVKLDIVKKQLEQELNKLKEE